MATKLVLETIGRSKTVINDIELATVKYQVNAEFRSRIDPYPYTKEYYQLTIYSEITEGAVRWFGSAEGYTRPSFPANLDGYKTIEEVIKAVEKAFSIIVVINDDGDTKPYHKVTPFFTLENPSPRL